MAMSDKEIFEAALKMIQVTPENYKSLNASMILYLCEVVAEAEKLCEKPSAYNDLSNDEIMKRLVP